MPCATGTLDTTARRYNMAEIGDIANEFIREEVDEFLEKDDERDHIARVR